MNFSPTNPAARGGSNPGDDERPQPPANNVSSNVNNPLSPQTSQFTDAKTSTSRSLRFGTLSEEYAKQMPWFPSLPKIMPEHCRKEWVKAAVLLARALTNSESTLSRDGTAIDRKTSERDLLHLTHSAALVLAEAGINDRFVKFDSSKSLFASIVDYATANICRLVSVRPRVNLGSASDVVAADGMLQLLIAGLEPQPELLVRVIDEISATINKVRANSMRPGAESFTTLMAAFNGTQIIPLASIPRLATYHLAIRVAHAYGASPKILPAFERLLKTLGLTQLGLDQEFIEYGQAIWERQNTEAINRLGLSGEFPPP